MAPFKRSEAALKKAQTHTLEDGSPTHSFQTLMAQFQTVVCNTFRSANDAENAPTFKVPTTPEKGKSAHAS